MLEFVRVRGSILGVDVSSLRKLPIGEWIPVPLPFAMGISASIHMALRGFSTSLMILAVVSFSVLAALLSSQGLRRSKVFSEALQTTVWRVVFISSSIHDESGGLFPTMYGVMFGFSAYLLFTTIRDRDGGRSDSESGQMT